jgi:hypothetical protein
LAVDGQVMDVVLLPAIGALPSFSEVIRERYRAMVRSS